MDNAPKNTPNQGSERSEIERAQNDQKRENPALAQTTTGGAEMGDKKTAAGVSPAQSVTGPANSGHNQVAHEGQASAASTPQVPLKIRLAAAVIYYLLRIFYATCRVSELGAQTLPKTPCIVLFWHSRLAFMGFLYRLQRRRGYAKTPHVLISTHKDGLLISAVMARFGIRTIAGSSNRGPVGALLAIRKVLAAGDDVFITPDGPRGPARTIAPGALAAAAKFAATLVVASNSATRAWRFGSWDAMILPKPFSRVCFALSTPVAAEESAALAAFCALENLQKEAGFYA